MTLVCRQFLHSGEMRKVGYEPKVWSPDDLAAFLVEESRAWGAIAKEVGLRLG